MIAFFDFFFRRLVQMGGALHPIDPRPWSQDHPITIRVAWSLGYMPVVEWWWPCNSFITQTGALTEGTSTFYAFFYVLIIFQMVFFYSINISKMLNLRVITIANLLIFIYLFKTTYMLVGVWSPCFVQLVDFLLTFICAF